MFKDYEESLRLRSLIMKEELPSFLSIYPSKRGSILFLKSLKKLIETDPFLLFDETLYEEIRNTINNLTFHHSNSEEIRTLRKQIITLLLELQNKQEEEKERIRLETLQRERRERKIPEEIPFNQEILKKMYQYDFECYLAMYNQEVEINKIPPFYFLATINRIANDYIEYAKNSKIIVFYRFIEMNLSESQQLKTYLEDTKKKLDFGKGKILTLKNQ